MTFASLCHDGAILLVAAAVGRVAFLLLCRQPVLARVLGSDLTEIQRRHDGAAHQAARRDGLPSTEDIPWRSVLVRVEYEISGITHRGDVPMLVDKGARPGGAATIWVDRRDPTRATGIGPLWVTPLLVLAGALLVAGSYARF